MQSENVPYSTILIKGAFSHSRHGKWQLGRWTHTEYLTGKYF